MSGKSTYLRQVALLTVLAHIGCFVPAESATFRLVNHILTSISNEEGIELSASSFSAEMRDMSYVLKELSSTSLCIIDELGMLHEEC